MIRSKSRQESVFKEYKNCLKCGISLEKKKGWKYCSQRCSKTFLKKEYRKRNRTRISKYNQQYRERATGVYNATSSTKTRLKSTMNKCQGCETKEGLNCCHIKPHWAGGQNHEHNFVIFCQTCHHKFDEATRPFWMQCFKQKLPLDIPHQTT